MGNIVEYKRKYFFNDNGDYIKSSSLYFEGENGKLILSMQLLWFKDPSIPFIVIDMTNTKQFMNNNFNLGLKQLKDFIINEIPDDEDIYLFWEEYKLAILFESVESLSAFKLKFDTDGTSFSYSSSYPFHH